MKSWSIPLVTGRALASVRIFRGSSRRNSSLCAHPFACVGFGVTCGCVIPPAQTRARRQEARQRATWRTASRQYGSPTFQFPTRRQAHAALLRLASIRAQTPYGVSRVGGVAAQLEQPDSLWHRRVRRRLEASSNPRPDVATSAFAVPGASDCSSVMFPHELS
jgi:hypothetical protein